MLILFPLSQELAQKIFDIARSFETLSKAFLAAYGTLIIYPALLISAVKKGHVRALRQLQKTLNSLTILLKQALNLKKIKENLGHDPLGKSQIPYLLITTAKFLRQIQEKQLAEVYENIAEYLRKPANERTYSDLLELGKMITKTVQFKNNYEQLLKIIEKMYFTRSC
ncbi:hypothetical protein [Saccharolobus shibatae]|uniref:Uncharacterized protein n=1 Tax=Saccharolobus shibatae TaxID=2286 RepID=A0A8F5BZ63_9CREN|nr:hypothetical protein [Saccharolobus shibatae]QXJ34173.1 hypothetical protein J5U22_00719 [Saccharolobus shibatae]